MTEESYQLHTEPQDWPAARKTIGIPRIRQVANRLLVLKGESYLCGFQNLRTLMQLHRFYALGEPNVDEVRIHRVMVGPENDLVEAAARDGVMLSGFSPYAPEAPMVAFKQARRGDDIAIGIKNYGPTVLLSMWFDVVEFP